jgi:hypothetical protein
MLFLQELSKIMTSPSVQLSSSLSEEALTKTIGTTLASRKRLKAVPSCSRFSERCTMRDTRSTAIDLSRWTITREKTKLGEVTRGQYGSFMLSPAPGRVFRSDELDSITAFMHMEHDRDAVTLLPN